MDNKRAVGKVSYVLHEKSIQEGINFITGTISGETDVQFESAKITILNNSTIVDGYITRSSSITDDSFFEQPF